MKPPSPHILRAVMRVLIWCGSIAIPIVIFRAYRWAEPTAAMLSYGQHPGTGSASLQLRDTPFAGYVGGARAWSIHAGQVDIQRVPNTSLTNIQTASILDIRDGNLYDPPNKLLPVTGAVTANVMEASGPAANSGPIAATFRAKEGHYSVGAADAAPPDLQMLYTVQWQLRLVGDVFFRTRAKDELAAPSMTIYNLVNRRTGRPEQRILCDQGAKMNHLGVQVTANSIRFNPKDRTVDCLSGVRATYKAGSVQAERVYWSMNDETLRCPETATGTIQGMPFSAANITMDLKHRIHHGNDLRIQLKPESEAFLGVSK